MKLGNWLAMFQFNSTSIFNTILYRYSRQDTSKWRQAYHAYIRKLKITLRFMDFNALLISNAVFDAILDKMNWRRSLHSVDTAGERYAYVLLNLKTCEIGNQIGFPSPSSLCPGGRGAGGGGRGFNWLMDKIRHDFRVLREVNVLKFHLSLESRQNLIAVQCYRPIETGVIMHCVPITTDCISFWDRSLRIQQLCLQQQSCCWIWTPPSYVRKTGVGFAWV